MERFTRIALVATITALASAMFAGVASADGATVTKGTFSAFAAGTTNAAYADLAGHATMVRTASGTTKVMVNVSGLPANTSFGSHVHAARCEVGDANGHYKDDPAGVGTPPNELWPAFTTNDDGVGNGKDTADWIARETAVSVVIHAPGGAKIGCANLW